MNKENGNIVQAIQLIPGKEERVIKWLNDRKIDFASGKNQSLVIIDAGKENEEGNYDDWIIYDSEKIIVMNNHEFLVNYKEYNGVL
jgi:hypothetical protein